MNTFGIESGTGLAFIILVLNGNQVYVYCKYVGAPYRNQKFYKKVRKLGFVCGMWSISFGIKFIYTWLGLNLINIDENAHKHRPVDEDFRSAVLIAA